MSSISLEKVNCGLKLQYCLMNFCNFKNTVYCICILCFRLYSSKDTTVAGVQENLNPTGVEKKKLNKKLVVEKILLISEKGDVLETTLADAEKLAKKKGCLLSQDTEHKIKSEKKVYRLETNAAHYGSDWKNGSAGSGSASTYIFLFNSD